MKCTRKQLANSRSCWQNLGMTFSQLTSRHQKECRQLFYFIKIKDFLNAEQQIIGKQEKDIYFGGNF